MWPFTSSSVTTQPSAGPQRLEQYVPADPSRQPPRTWLGWVRSVVGGLPGPKALTTLPAFAEDRYELEREKVSSGPPGIILPNFAPFIDDVTGETVAIRGAYRKMIAEPNVKAALLGKLLNVAALDLKVVPAGRGRLATDRRAAEFVEYCLTDSVEEGWVGVVWSILSGGLIDGYSVCEKVYGPEKDGRWANLWALHALKAKDTGNDVVLQTDDKKNVTSVLGLRYNAGKVFSPGLFIIWRHLPLYNAPTGMSDFRAAYQSWWMLDTAKKLRAIAVEKNAVGVVVGTYPPGATHVKPDLDRALTALRSRHFISVPEGTKVELLNIAGSADAIFDQFCLRMVHEITRSIEGAVLQSLEGTVEDGRGNSAVHNKKADRRSWALAASLMALFNNRRTGLIREIVDFNFVASDYPKISLAGVDPQELLNDLQIDQGLQALGLDLSKQALYEHYAREQPDPQEPGDVLSAVPPPPEPMPGDPALPPGQAPTVGASPPEQFAERPRPGQRKRRVIRVPRKKVQVA